MLYEYDNVPVTETDEGVGLSLPDGSSVEVPHATIRRSALLQETLTSVYMGETRPLIFRGAFCRTGCRALTA